MLRVLIILNLLLFQDGEPKVVSIPIDDPAYTVLTSLDTKEYYESSSFYLMIHNKMNPPGSAGGGSHDITRSFYLVISDNDDDPKRSVFEIGPFLSPKIKEIREAKDLIEIDIDHYWNEERTIKTVVVGHHSVVLRN